MNEPVNQIEAKQRKINQWLRYHTDYRVTINLCDIYGVVSATITLKGELVKQFWGNHLEKRLDEVISYLKIDGQQERTVSAISDG